MTEETGYEGYYEITDKTGPAEPDFHCSCGVVVWGVEAHIVHHQRHGEVCTVKRQA